MRLRFRNCHWNIRQSVIRRFGQSANLDLVYWFDDSSWLAKAVDCVHSMSAGVRKFSALITHRPPCFDWNKWRTEYSTSRVGLFVKFYPHIPSHNVQCHNFCYCQNFCWEKTKIFNSGFLKAAVYCNCKNLLQSHIMYLNRGQPVGGNVSSDITDLTVPIIELQFCKILSSSAYFWRNIVDLVV